MSQKIEFTRVSNDVNGNPRYVCGFLNLLNAEDHKNLESKFPYLSIEAKYIFAIKRAKRIGGKKFHNKQYGGGIVFQSYNIADTERRILELVNNTQTAKTV